MRSLVSRGVCLLTVFGCFSLISIVLLRSKTFPIGASCPQYCDGGTYCEGQVPTAISQALAEHEQKKRRAKLHEEFTNQHLKFNFSLWPRRCVAPLHDFAQGRALVRKPVSKFPPFIIALVNSEGKRFEDREIVRQTWGHPYWFQFTRTRIYFLLARDKDPNVNRRLADEAAHHDDIIQGAFDENYHTMSKKILAGLRWVSNNCQNYTFLLKTDDDMLIDIFRISFELLFRNNETLLRRVETDLKNSELIVPLDPDDPKLMTSPDPLRHVSSDYAHMHKTIFCAYAPDWTPIRKLTDKYYLSCADFAPEVFPPFCRGSMYVLTHDLPAQMYKAAYYAPYVWLEDVFVTGLLIESIGGVDFVDWNSHGYYKYGRESTVITGKFWYAHISQPEMRKSLWNRLLGARGIEASRFGVHFEEH